MAKDKTESETRGDAKPEVEAERAHAEEPHAELDAASDGTTEVIAELEKDIATDSDAGKAPEDAAADADDTADADDAADTDDTDDAADADEDPDDAVFDASPEEEVEPADDAGPDQEAGEAFDTDVDADADSDVDAADEAVLDGPPEDEPQPEPNPAPEPELTSSGAADAAPEDGPVAKRLARFGPVPVEAVEAVEAVPAAVVAAPASIRSFDMRGGTGQKSDRKVALVTGASGGIGEAFARKLATDGYALVLVARSDGELNRVAGLVTAEHDLPVATIPMDLTSPDAAAEIEMEFDKRNITPEIVVNNAGFGLNGPVADLDHQRQIDMVDVNIRMLTDLSMRFIPTMRERGRGGIINIASTAAYMSGPYMAVYYASKAYVLSFSEALATELKGTGITVTTVCPGPTATGFQEAAGMAKSAVVKLFPMMSAEEVVELGYQGFRSGKRVVIPGTLNRITAAAAPMIPNRILLPIMRMLQGPRS